MSLAELQEELTSYQSDLDFLVNEALVADPNDAESLEMKATLEESIADVKKRITAQKGANSSAPPPPPGDDSAPKYDMSKHPKFAKNAGDSTQDDSRVIFNTGDAVMAKYSVDKQWYAATIVGKTGSSADPVYSVKFTGYPDRENKRKHEVRPVENKKRKADGPPAAAATAATVAPSVPLPPSPKPTQTGTVISAAPSIDPNLVPKREPSKVSDGPTRMAPAPKKMKTNKALEKGKSSWNAWQQKAGGNKKLNKESQFRTPDLPNAKVGFTGSGKPMSKDQARTKWTYGHEEPDAD